jgi:hypothetical protein
MRKLVQDRFSLVVISILAVSAVAVIATLAVKVAQSGPSALLAPLMWIAVGAFIASRKSRS